MYSRTTSLGSLSSFPAQPTLDDTGSVLSEFRWGTGGCGSGGGKGGYTGSVHSEFTQSTGVMGVGVSNRDTPAQFS